MTELLLAIFVIEIAVYINHIIYRNKKYDKENNERYETQKNMMNLQAEQIRTQKEAIKHVEEMNKINEKIIKEKED